MDLAAKKKKQTKAVESVEKREDKTVANTDIQDTYSHSITLQVNTLLYTTLQNMVEAAHTANDFTYTSVTDVIRAALEAYREGMNLTELDQPGKKKQTSIRVTRSLYDFYKSLPNQMRTKIIERAIRTYLKNL